MNRLLSLIMAAVFAVLSFFGIPYEAPDLKLLPEIKVTLSAEEKELLQSVFKSETEWLASLQLDNGAIPMTKAENGEVKMNPYFADFAALALLDCGTEYASQVKEYIEWHFNHLNSAITDYNGIDGTIYDYVITVSNGKVINESVGEKKSYDSTDSYAATFLMVLNKYSGVTKDTEYLVSRSGDIERVANAMFSTMHRGLTFAKPDYKVKYLMDNCEVYEGARAAAELFEKALCNSSYAEKCTEAANQIKKAIESKLWNGTEGFYRVAVNKNGFNAVGFSWNEYYPSATSQLFPIICGIIEPNTERTAAIYSKFSETYKWETLDIPDVFCWGSNVYASVLMGDSEKAVCYMTEYRKAFAEHSYPLYNADSARVAMAAHILLEKSEN